MPNYRSLVPGGFYSSPANTGDNPSIRYNNPGAINGNAAWVKAMPGFVNTRTIAGNNPIAIFETPEQGVAAWYELLRRYRAAGAKTVRDIVVRYGGGQANYASQYVPFVVRHSGYPATKEIVRENFTDLLPFAKAMFWMEAGKKTPLTDAQIMHGFALGRDYKPGASKESKAAGGVAGAGGAAAAVAASSGFPWEVAFGIAVFTAVVALCVWLYVRGGKPENDPAHVDAALPPAQPDEGK